MPAPCVLILIRDVIATRLKCHECRDCLPSSPRYTRRRVIAARLTNIRPVKNGLDGGLKLLQCENKLKEKIALT